jgi:hypothetical protein
MAHEPNIADKILKRRLELGPDAFVFGGASGAHQPNIQTTWKTLWR